MRDGGRGRGFERREEASSSVNVGRFCLSGVTGIGNPFAFPRPLPVGIDGGVSRGLSDGGGVLDGGNGLLDTRSAASVRAFLGADSREGEDMPLSAGGVMGLGRLVRCRGGDDDKWGKLDDGSRGTLIRSSGDFGKGGEPKGDEDEARGIGGGFSRTGFDRSPGGVDVTNCVGNEGGRYSCGS